MGQTQSTPKTVLDPAHAKLSRTKSIKQAKLKSLLAKRAGFRKAIDKLSVQYDTLDPKLVTLRNNIYKIDVQLQNYM